MEKNSALTNNKVKILQNLESEINRHVEFLIFFILLLFPQLLALIDLNNIS